MQTELLQRTVFWQLESILPTEKKIVVGVSWWPDSMALLWLIQQFYITKKRSASNICVAHYNHGQREESKQEYQFLKEYCDDHWFFWNNTIPKKGLSETKLRNLRHGFFAEVMNESKTDMLFLGHNLTDRIETTVLNMARGADVTGFLWIKPQATKTTYTQYRPLLSFSKKEIQQFCDANTIPYFVDVTNDQNITTRNILRNQIFPAIYKLHNWWEKNWISSWSAVYRYIDSQVNQSEKTCLQEYTPNKYWWSTLWFSFGKKSVSDQLLYTLFRKKETAYPTKEKIKKLYEFIKSPSEWWFFVQWLYFFKQWDRIHCVDGTTKFWEKHYTTKKYITHSWLLQFDGNIYIMKPEWIWGYIRYPQKGDVYKKKSLSKALSAKKIPIFARNTVPVIEKQKEIIYILD